MNTEIRLPEKHEMERRLLQVDQDRNLQHHFYPELLKHAGQVVRVHSIITAILLAMENFLAEATSFTVVTMHMQAPQFVEALFDDLQSAETAKKVLHNELRARSNPKTV